MTESLGEGEPDLCTAMLPIMERLASIMASATPAAHVRGKNASPSEERSVQGFRRTLRSQRLADAMIKAFHLSEPDMVALGMLP